MRHDDLCCLFRRNLGFLVALLCLCSSAISPVRAQSGEDMPIAQMRGMDMQGFGRIVFSFDHLPVVDMSQSNGVLVLSFDHAFKIDPSRLGLEVPSYISAARIDPDRHAIRMALAKAVKPNLIEAGNDLYVDLLPIGWKGPVPSLPIDVVQGLSRKARLADAMTKSAEVDNHRTLTVDMASSSHLSRLMFRGMVADEVHIETTDISAILRFSGKWSLDLARLRAELPRGFASVAAETRDGSLVVTIGAVEGVKLGARIEDGGAVVEVVFKGVGFNHIPTQPEPIITGATLAEPSVARNREAVANAKPEVPVSDRPPEIVFSDDAGTPQISLNGFNQVPIAVFSRAHAVWLAFDLKIDPVLQGSFSPTMDDPLDIRSGRKGALYFVRLEGKRLLSPSISTIGEDMSVRLSQDADKLPLELPLTPVPGANGSYQLDAGLTAVGHIVQLDDPVVGDKIMVAPTRLTHIGVSRLRHFPEFDVLASAQGLAVVPVADDIEMHASVEQVIVSRSDGLALADGDQESGAQQISRSVINRARWDRDKTLTVLDRRKELMDIAASAPINDQKRRRQELARFLAANGLYREAAAAFISGFDSRIETIDEPRDRLELGIYEALGSDWRAAWDNLSDIRLTGNEEAQLWRAYLAVQNGRFAEALGDYRQSGTILGLYPDEVQLALRVAFAEAAVESGDWGLANDMEKALRASITGAPPDMLDYFRARIEEASGALEEAHKAYEGLSKNKARGVEVRATASLAALDLRLAQMDPAKALALYENLALFWRGDFLEAKLLALAARVALDTKKWRNAFLAVQRLNRLYADTDGVRPLLEEVTLRFDALIGGEQPDSISPVDAVALFMEFREFMPTGRRADELVGKYIERLANLDLLPQATELLRYQIEYRLDGLPRAAAAVRLATFYLIERKPIDAVRVLAATRANGLPNDLRITRRLIEARARSDLGEIKAASELLDGLDGSEANIARADVFWKAKNWTQAGENYEAALGDSWRVEGALSPDALKIALRAASAYVLADDRLASERFSQRYAGKLTASPDSGVFRLLTAPLAARMPMAHAVAQEKADPNLLDNFLKSYRIRYGLGADAASADTSPPAPTTPKPAG